MPTHRIYNRAHVAVLVVLLAAFVLRVLAQLIQFFSEVDSWAVLRVLAQLIQFFSEVDWLPSFAAWAAGGLPYPLLVGMQVFIIAIALNVIRKIAQNDLRPRRNWAFFLTGAGGVYFVAMAFRLLAGATFLADNTWFTASLPAIFHLILAGFVLALYQ